MIEDDEEMVVINVRISDADVEIDVSSMFCELNWTSSVSCVMSVFESSVMESQSSSN